MTKFRVKLVHSSSSYDNIGTYNTIEDAAEEGYSYAHRKGYTRSNCDNRESVVESLTMRQFCMLGYGPDCIEVEEVNS